MICLCSRAWFCWFPAQKFCRNWWANFMMSCIRKSSPWRGRSAILQQSQRKTWLQEREIPRYLLVWDLKQLENNGVGPHVSQQPLLLLLALPARQTFLDTQLAETQQDLVEGRSVRAVRCVRESVSKNCRLKSVPPSPPCNCNCWCFRVSLSCLCPLHHPAVNTRDKHCEK